LILFGEFGCRIEQIERVEGSVKLSAVSEIQHSEENRLAAEDLTEPISALVDLSKNPAWI